MVRQVADVALAQLPMPVEDQGRQGTIAQEAAAFRFVRERDFFCARIRTTDVGAREMPRSVVTAEQVCNGGKCLQNKAHVLQTWIWT